MTWSLKRLQRAHAHLTLAPFSQSILHSFQSTLTSNQKSETLFTLQFLNNG